MNAMDHNANKKDLEKNTSPSAGKTAPADGTKDMTVGSPLRLIVGFALPTLCGLLFQQLYNLVDTAIVGHYLGVNAFAGVGSTGSVNFLVLGFCVGICGGFAIPVAQCFGAKDWEGLKKMLGGCVWLGVFYSIFLTTLVLILCRQILTWMNTPAEIFDYAYQYIFIMFAGIPCIILYNITAAILRSMGDSKTPVLLLVASSLLNILLDLAFIVLLGMSVDGAALATVISQGFSAIVCLFYMVKRYEICQLEKRYLAFDLTCIRKLSVIGLPMGFQYSITAIGSVVIQTAINGFGALCVAGVTAAGKVHNLTGCPYEALGQTMAAYAGQNVGAKKYDRIDKGITAACFCGFVVWIVLLIFLIFFGRKLPLLFLTDPDPEIIEYAYVYLLATAAFYCLLTLVNVIRFSIQGMGFSGFAVFAGVMEMLARTLAGFVLVAYIGFSGICASNFLAWIFADAFLVPAYFICKKKLLKIDSMA